MNGLEEAAVVVVVIAAYWLPMIAAWVNRAPSKGSVFVVNLLLGWTIIGWIVALAMAMRDPARAPS